jgi:hypothetical protein
LQKNYEKHGRYVVKKNMLKDIIRNGDDESLYVNPSGDGDEQN